MSGSTQDQATSEARRHRTDLLWCTSLALAVLLLFGTILGHPFVIYDDVSYLLQNPTVTNPATVNPLDLVFTPQLRYVVPLTVFVNMGLYHGGGAAAWPFHLVAVLLHATLAIQIFMVGRRLSKSSLASGLAAAIFCVQPLVVEPVAWATGLKDVLMANLALAATWAFLEGVRAQDERGSMGRWWIWALALLILSVLAKPATVGVGAAWMAYLVAGHLRRRAHSGADRGERGQSTAWRVAGAAILIGGAFAALNLVIYRALIFKPDGQGGVVSFSDPFMAAGYHLHHLFVPTNLHPMYPIDRALGFEDPHTWLGVGFVVLAVASVYWVRRSPTLVVGLGLAAATYLPVSNLVYFPRFLADSYLYAPLAGCALALAVGLAWGIEHVEALLTKARNANSGRGTLRKQRISMAVITALVALLWASMAWTTFGQVKRWEGGRALWNPLIEEYPQWGAGHFTLGHSLHFFGDDQSAAAASFRRGFQIAYDPDSLGSYAVSLARIGRLDDAECVFLESFYHGREQRSALRNYGVFMASHPDRQPVHRARAAVLLPKVADQTELPSFGWPSNLTPGLRQQLAKVGPPRPVQPWPRRVCSSLAKY